MIQDKFNVGVQTIEEQITNGNHTDVVIEQGRWKMTSFECEVVVYVKTSQFNDDRMREYTMLSRARTTCMVIDVAASPTTNRPPPIEHVELDVVGWEAVDGKFQKTLCYTVVSE